MDQPTVDPRTFLGDLDRQDLEKAIGEAELRTSGEIRIHIERTCDDPLHRGMEVFEALGMAATQERNGVLFFLAVESRKFAILGDEGINNNVPAGFWDGIKEMMIREFVQGRFKEGLKQGVLAAGEQLATYFPAKPGDKNELPDTISFGDQ